MLGKISLRKDFININYLTYKVRFLQELLNLLADFRNVFNTAVDSKNPC